MQRQTKGTLNSIRDLTELARTKISDREFGDFFYRSVKEDILKADLLLEGFLQYLFINNPLKKKDTVHRMMEEVLKDYQGQLGKKGVKLSRKYEEGLPETIIPDAPLRYILNAVLQYVVNSVTPDGDMEFLTGSFILQRDPGAGRGVLRKGERYIEIKVFFTSCKKMGRQFKESPIFQKEEPLDLLLQLAQEVVRENRGTMRFETDEKEGNTSISIRFPSERREIVYYQSVNQFMH